MNKRLNFLQTLHANAIKNFWISIKISLKCVPEVFLESRHWLIHVFNICPTRKNEACCLAAIARTTILVPWPEVMSLYKKSEDRAPANEIYACDHPIIETAAVTWFNSLWPSDDIWRQGSRSTLAQVMACCLTAPSHYLNQCWLMISEVLWHTPDSNFTGNTYRWNEFEIY